MMDQWFWDGGMWHAFKEGTAFWCGYTLVELNDDQLVQATEKDPYPPAPCPKCLHETAMRDVADEPLDVAKRRGYYRGAPLD